MSQYPTLTPGCIYFFWSGLSNLDPKKAVAAKLEKILSDTHRQKYITDKGIFDFVSVLVPLVDGVFKVTLIRTEKKDPKTGEMIELDKPVEINTLILHATNAFHLWEIMWYTLSAHMTMADTFDSNLLSQKLYSDYETQSQSQEPI